MMPGETHSAAPGTAADLSRCQGCVSLQQNLNEYVEALITLKQKIINTDNLLTEYQKKFIQLQFARRENSTLHHQVEQMLQKISPLQKCQEELGSLKAELEEKKSSLKLYQDTHQEYARVKEECLKSDAQKKKLEAKVKKLEEAAVKQTQDFKQLRNEKKILEKEFKKTQERLDEFSKQKNEKELRHIGTQISNDSHGSIDKRKVKLLLKELWLCVNATPRLPGEDSSCVLEISSKENTRSRVFGEDDTLPPAQGSPFRSLDVQSCLTELSMELEDDLSSCKDVEQEWPGRANYGTDCVFKEAGNPEIVMQSHNDGDSTDFSDHDHFFDEDLQAAIDFFKLPPPLLSPVPSPPLMSPHVASLPSSLAPETYFGECTDSSDNDSAQLRNSTESVSEDDTTESQNYFASFRKNKQSSISEENPKFHGSIQALSTLEVNKTTTLGFETSTAALKEPLAHEKHWTMSSQFVSDRKRDILQEAEKQTEIRGKDKSVQTERTFPKPTLSLGIEKLSGSQAEGNEAVPGELELWHSPPGKRPLNEPSESEGKTLLSKVIESPKSEFTKWALTKEITSESDCVTGSDHLREASGEMERETEDMQGFILGESPESEDDDAGDAMDVAGLDTEASVSSSSSLALSVCSNPQLSSGLECVNDTSSPTKVFPAELHHLKQKLQTKILNTLNLQSEPPECSVGGNSLEKSLRAFSPELRASNFNDQKSSEVECTKVVKDMTKIHLLPQSVFMKATKDGQCESQDLGIELALSKPEFTSLIDSQAGLIKGGLGFLKSTSWHHSDLLRRGGEASLRAKSGQEQKAAPSLQYEAPVPMPDLPRENNNPVEFKTTSLLPNQVSVITKQARPEKIPSAELEHLRLRGNEPTLATGESDNETDDMSSTAKCDGERDDTSQKSKEVAAVKSTSPEVSTSRRKLDFSSPSDSIPVENSDCSINNELSFSSENICVQNQDLVREAGVQGDATVQKQKLLPQATDPDSSGTGGSELLPATEVTASGGFSVEEDPCETSAVANSSNILQNANELLKLKSKTPGGAFPECFVTTSTSSAFCRKDGETQGISPSSLADTLHCYTGIREEKEDTEVEESEGLSCSEGEHDEQQDATGDPQKDLGDTGAGVAETRPSLDIGYLTSALQDFTISTLSELDRLSTSDVVTFLESCQLRDYSSGDSVSECSSKGTLNKEMNKELKQSEISGEKYEEQPCEEETLGTSEEWIESEDDDSLKNTSQFTQCSLETLSEVLTKIGQELQTNYEDCDGKDTDNLLLLNIHNNTTSDNLREKAPPQEMTSSLAHTSEPPPLAADLDTGGSSPISSGPNNENTQNRPEDGQDASRHADSGEERQAGPAEPPALCCDSAVEPVTEQSASCEVETTFQYQISTVTPEVINVLINKDQNLVIENGDNWTVISGMAVVPPMEQVTLCEAPGDIPVSQDQGGVDAGCVPVASVEKSPEASLAAPPCQEPPCGSSTNLSCPQEDVSSSAQSTNFDKSRLRNRPVKPSIWISSQIYDQDFDSQTVPSDHTYYNSKLEPFGKNKNRSKISNKDQSNKTVKTLASSRIEAHQSEVSQSFSGEKSNTKTQRSQTQTILANADTSAPTDCSPDTLSKIRQEVGPPLPPLLAPLIATPPRTAQPLSPLALSCSPSSPPSPVSQISPFCEIPVPPVMSPWPEDPRRTSPLGPSPSPSAASAGERIVSSPLQFCAATPKHALPVPGRLPPCASGHAPVGGPQENSVKILDTMYPELSARARTLNILKGNLQLGRGPSTDCKNLSGPVSAMIGFKAITSTSTAFVKTGNSSGGDQSSGSQDKARNLRTQQDSSGKRTLSAPTLRSAKRLRLDGGSPEPEIRAPAEGIHKNLQRKLPQAEVTTEEERSCSSPAISTVSQLPLNPKETVESHDKAIANALKKIAELSFDLLPVIRSHVYVGNISKKPVMRDQEKEVVYEFSTTKKHLAECLLHSILSELKIQKMSTDHNYIHALCRVYVGICRQLGDLERARLLCYSLLKEDFPESEKLTLFIANMWHDVFLSQSVINKAMQLVARHRAKGEVLNCLRAFLNWEKNAPADVGFMVSKLLLTIQLCPKTEFQSSEKFGEDLSDNTWEYIFAIDLLCSHQKWIWTHDNIISKELWPVMDKWIKYRKGHANIAYIPDVIIASILRLIGRLGQLGLKEGFPSAVKNISSVIGMFIQHAQDEDIPWGIQLAAVYALCDLSPSNPAEICKILEAWRREASKNVPSAILSYLEEVGALSAEGLG
uniref:Interactor of little elongation complex ELL subunit 1 n=1 Tax=Microcebus murinus TaxID=30608 RepID=A0A8C5XPA6_MICMU